jgi:hypothetical protein
MTTTTTLSDFAARLRGRMTSSDLAWASGVSQDGAFAGLALELFGLQFTYNPAYRRLCLAQGRAPETVRAWPDIPAVPTAAFKEFEFTSLSAAELTVTFHSSGTTGQTPSRHHHSAASLALYEASVLAWFKARWADVEVRPHEQSVAESWPGRPARAGGETHKPKDRLGDSKPGWDARAAGREWMLFLTPPREHAPHSSLAHMFDTLGRECGTPDSGFTGALNSQGHWGLDFEATRAVLKESSRTRRPLALLGTAFNFVHLLDALAGHGLRFELPGGSWALETGGYKGRSRTLPRAELHALIARRLGIPPRRVICEYGMCELSSQAYARGEGESANLDPIARWFRFPPWARAQVVSPETGQEVAEGQTGLIRVFDLANVWSVMAIQTEDLGVRRGDGFELLGRAARAEPRGCSLMSAGVE